jgi:hypothetical protein
MGGLIAIGAMTLFMNLGWESFGGWGIFFISLAYAGIGFKLVGRRVIHSQVLRIMSNLAYPGFTTVAADHEHDSRHRQLI